MVIVGGPESKKGLQQSMDVRRGEQILAARDKRDILDVVVECGRKMVARAHFLAGQHDVPETFGCRHLFAARAIAPAKRPRARFRFRDIETERIGPARSNANVALRRREVPAGAGIKWPLGAVGCRRGPQDLRGDLCTGAKTRIYDAHIAEASECRLIFDHMFGLPSHSLFQLKAKPSKIRANARLEFGAATSLIDILNTKKKPAAGIMSRAPREESGI